MADGQLRDRPDQRSVAAIRAAWIARERRQAFLFSAHTDSTKDEHATLQGLLDDHGSTHAATILTARLEDPTGYGRIVRLADGEVGGIVEHKDADSDQREIDEINSGMYAFAGDRLADCLGRLTTDNVQGEEYLTDVIGMMRGDGDTVAAALCGDADEIGRAHV